MANDIRQIVKRCLRGDQGAMIELVDQFRGQVFGLCYRMLGQRQDAEDAAQETFVRLLKSLHHWDSSRDFEPWMLAIAGNRCRTALARRQRRPDSQPLLEPVADASPDSSAADQLGEELALALAGLRPEYRQAFALFHEHQMGYAEIAQVMGSPLGTIKTWVHRARRELIDQLRQREVIEETRYAV